MNSADVCLLNQYVRLSDVVLTYHIVGFFSVSTYHTTGVKTHREKRL